MNTTKEYYMNISSIFGIYSLKIVEALFQTNTNLITVEVHSNIDLNTMLCFTYKFSSPFELKFTSFSKKLLPFKPLDLNIDYENSIVTQSFTFIESLIVIVIIIIVCNIINFGVAVVVEVVVVIIITFIIFIITSI